MDLEDPRFKASWADESNYLPPGPGELFPFQRAGVEYALSGDLSTIIGDQMGLGKTVQALACANALGLREMLVLCPASLRINWRREAEKWLIWTDCKVVGYEEAVSKPEKVRGKWPLVVCDEAQYLKNPEAKRTKLALGVNGERRLYLSGTPIVNRPIELWPMLYSIDPDRWSDHHSFGLRYANARQVRRPVKRRRGGEMTTQYEMTWDYSGASNLRELQYLVRSTCMVRRLKKDVLSQLPAKQHQIVPLPSRVAGASEKLLRRAKALTRARPSTPVEIAKLRQEKKLVLEQMAKARHDQALAKMGAATAYLRDILETGEQVVVFAHHRDVIAKLREAFADSVQVVGGMSDTDKQSAVDRFQQGNVQLFFGNIQAAGTGLTLTSARIVIFVELDWTPGAMEQAEDRCHRIGQTREVQVIHLVLDGSIDAHIAKTLLSKQQTITAALDGGLEVGDSFDRMFS